MVRRPAWPQYREQYGPRYRRVRRGGFPFIFGVTVLVMVVVIMAITAVMVVIGLSA